MISRFGLLLSLLILISAFAEINAERKHNARKVYLFKPLTMLLILVLAWIQGVPSSGMYSLLIFIGLILSLGGDVALMWPKDRFLVGLVFFLMAHVSYIGAFFNGMTGTLSIWNGIPFLSLALIVFGLLHSRLGKLKNPSAHIQSGFGNHGMGCLGKVFGASRNPNSCSLWRGSTFCAL